VEDFSWESGSPIKAPPTIHCYIGMPVSVTTNADENHQVFGVATGASGWVRRIVFDRQCTFWEENNLIICSMIPQYLIVELETRAELRFGDLPPNTDQLDQLTREEKLISNRQRRTLDTRTSTLRMIMMRSHSNHVLHKLFTGRSV
jgi:hypothetical protein